MFKYIIYYKDNLLYYQGTKLTIPLQQNAKFHENLLVCSKVIGRNGQTYEHIDFKIQFFPYKLFKKGYKEYNLYTMIYIHLFLV
jgi:hypothetical protein